MGLDLRNKFDFAANAFEGTATKDSTTDIDFKMSENLFLNGGLLLYKDAAWGDYFAIQIIDIDNILGYGANTILKNYITKWYVHPDTHCLELHAEYAGKVLKDLYVRLKYTSVGTTNDVKVKVNLRLHKEET